MRPIHLLAGTHDSKRKIVAITNGNEQTYYPDEGRTNDNSKSLLESSFLTSGIAYIKINNSLGNNDLIKAFDSALSKEFSSGALILDLREPPGGGNTTVARAIMGRFITKSLPYQLHTIPSGEQLYGIRRSWIELLSPRGKIYKKPMVVLVNR